MATVRDIMSTDLVTVEPATTVAEAATVMGGRHVGSALVLEDGRTVGIFTERDVLRMYAEGDRDFDALPVESRMTCSVVFGRPSMTVDEALGLMTQGRFRHLPVLEDDKLVGIVSIGDLVKHKISEVEAEADGLKAYIAAS